MKFLREDGRFTYIASGSLLGVTLSETTSIPMGSIRKIRMFPLDFEEFLYANGMNPTALKNFVENADYHVKQAFVRSNAREIHSKGKITHLPIYFVMFFQAQAGLGVL